MKLRHSLSIFGLVAMLGLGVGVGLASGQKPVEEAKADGDIRVYFDANNVNDFFGGDCTLRVHYWGAGAGKETSWSGVQMTQKINQFGRDIYYYDVPSGTKGLIFGKYANGAAANADPLNRWDIGDTSEYGPDDGYNFWQPTNYTGSYSTYKAFNATLHVEDKTSTELALNWANYTPANPSVSGKEFLNWCTNSTFATNYTPAVPSANVELWAKFANSAQIVFNDASTGDNLALSATEWSVTTAFTAGQKFKITKSLSGGGTSDFATLQGDVAAAVATSDGTYVTMVEAGTYSIYLKLPSDGENPNKIYIMKATPSSEAYSYADYFLANVGCSLPDAPTGWGLCQTRYAKVSADGRDEIAKYSANKAGNKIEEMLACYTYARINHPALANFLVDGSDTPIVARVATAAPETQLTSGNNTLIIVIAVSSIAVLALIGGYFYFRKRKEDR